MKLWAIPAVAILFAASGAANATIILDDSNTSGEMGTTAHIDSTNDAGYTGDVDLGQLRVDEAGQIRFEYLGNEAGYTNYLYLLIGNQLLFTATTDGFHDPGQFSDWFDVGAGYLPFSLCTSGGLSDATYGRCAANDNAASLIAQWNLGSGEGYRSIGFRQDSEDGNTWLIFWDDSGASNDDDYDDLIARVSFSPKQVPEPATLGLLGLGLAGLGFARRRKA